MTADLRTRNESSYPGATEAATSTRLRPPRLASYSARSAARNNASGVVDWSALHATPTLTVSRQWPPGSHTNRVASTADRKRSAA